MNSVLSSNNLDHLNSILYKKNEETLAEQQKHWHESSFIKQFVYFFVLYIINTGLTVSTFVNMDHSKALNLTDVNGMEHAIEPYHICVMLALGWTCFFSSYVMNFIYYKIHPSGVDFKKKRFRNRLHFYICGFEINHFMQNSKLQEFSNDSTTYKFVQPNVENRYQSLTPKMTKI